MHADFYDDPRTLYEIIEKNRIYLHGSNEQRWCIDALTSPTMKDPIKKKIMHNIVYKALATIYPDASNAIAAPPQPNLALRRGGRIMYSIFVKAGILEPMEILPIWKREVHSILDILQFSLVHPAPQKWSTVHTVFLNGLVPYLKGAKPAYTISYLLRLMGLNGFDKQNGYPQEVISTMWQNIFELALKHISLRPFLGISVETYVNPVVEYHRADCPHSQLLNDELRRSIIEMIRAAASQELKKIGDKFDAIKEELMAEMFKPARVAAALEAGIEPEDL
jgi:hypothetical protein